MAKMLGVWKPSFIHSEISRKLVREIIRAAGFPVGDKWFQIIRKPPDAILSVREDVHGLWTGINTREIVRTSRMVSRLTGYSVQPNKAVVGRNAFAHESGIHQDGVLKERSTYEIMDATEVGLESNSIVLGKHSGRHALKDALEQLGYKIDGAALRWNNGIAVHSTSPGPNSHADATAAAHRVLAADPV